jgi:hypothetical protein
VTSSGATGNKKTLSSDQLAHYKKKLYLFFFALGPLALVGLGLR